MPSINITQRNEDPHVATTGFRSDTGSRGVDLAGARITATYTDGSSQRLIWQAFDPFTNGGAMGTHIDMSFGFAFHQLTTTQALRSLEIDLQPSASVFDTSRLEDDETLGGSTPGSAGGHPFLVAPESEALAGTIEVTYSGIINLAGRPAEGDIYTTMLVDFTGLAGGGLLGQIEWSSDIDTLAEGGALTAFTDAPVTLVSGAGDDLLEGGSGIDRAVLDGPQDSYTLTLGPGGTTLTDRRADGTGTDTLVSIEILDFSGPPETEVNLFQQTGIASLDAPDLEVFVELYIAYFNRAPDAEGLGFWGTAFANGFSLNDIAALFINSDEYRTTYPDGLSNADFATTVYNNVLGRVPDQTGFDFWVSVLDGGDVSRDQFILSVLDGAKAAPPADATPAFIAQQLADREYLADKTDIGAYFSVLRGMSDVDNASAAMALFDGSDTSITAAVDAIDGFYADALDADSGEFLMQVVGVIDDPFSIV
jgi:hypothetical protein